LGLRAGLGRVQADDDNGGSRKQNQKPVRGRKL